MEHLADREIDGEVVLDEQRVEAMHAYLSKWGAG
ncbi:MAG: hypothetical protein ACI8XD_001538 [Thermoproteota archaeon]